MATLVAAVVLLPVGFSGVVTLIDTPEIYWLAVLMALLSTVVPTSCELAALRRLPRNTFSILLSLEPVFAALIGWVFLDQTFGILRTVAILLIIGATVGMTASAAKLSSEVVDQHEARKYTAESPETPNGWKISPFGHKMVTVWSRLSCKQIAQTFR